MGGVHLEKVAVGVAQVLVVPVAVAVMLVGAQPQVPVALVVEVAGETVAVRLEVVLVLLHGEFPQMQMAQIQPDGGELLRQDGKVQLGKLILVGMFRYFTIHRKRFESVNKKFCI